MAQARWVRFDYQSLDNIHPLPAFETSSAVQPVQLDLIRSQTIFHIRKTYPKVDDTSSRQDDNFTTLQEGEPELLLLCLALASSQSHFGSRSATSSVP